MPSDQTMQSAAAITEELRRWLRTRDASPQVLAITLAYELAALIALHCGSGEHAEALVDFWAETMKDQIRVLGTGVEHP